jgi:hypothetical protein
MKMKEAAKGDQPKGQEYDGEFSSAVPVENVSSLKCRSNDTLQNVEKIMSENKQTGGQTDGEPATTTQQEAVKDPEPAEEQPVQALVSSLSDLHDNMLVKSVLLAGKVVAAHLDTCATHCFLSRKASERLKRQGFAPTESQVQYRVEQGNPLCVTSTVHILPLAMVAQHGGYVTWKAVLFVVADCGADIIICYPILRLGGIVDYNPPEGYSTSLRTLASRSPTADELRDVAQGILLKGSAYEYEPPGKLYGTSVSFSDPPRVPPNHTTTVLKTQLENTSKPKITVNFLPRRP